MIALKEKIAALLEAVVDFAYGLPELIKGERGTFGAWPVLMHLDEFLAQRRIDQVGQNQHRGRRPGITRYFAGQRGDGRHR